MFGQLRELSVIQYSNMQKTEDQPSRKGAWSYQLILLCGLVHFGVLLDVVLFKIPIEHSDAENGEEANKTKTGHHPLIENRRSTKQRFVVVQNQKKRDDGILVKCIQNNHRCAQEIPSAVVQNEVFEESELPDGKVGSIHSLLPFLSGDSNSAMGRLDHSNIVSTVSDRQRYRFGTDVVSNHLHELRFLARRNSTSNDGFALTCNIEHQFFQYVVTLQVLQCSTFNHQCSGTLTRRFNRRNRCARQNLLALLLL
mmetsp:Transcript_32963/g.77844  ORF Transcript_32963/g.77844 Transcript_32963/m.77844 type:complete len:254 (-) Transcript_32963:730-1491(-)